MPIKIPSSLPAHNILENENIFIISENRAQQQDIRPLRLIILNLMPTKINTETQLLRCLSNTPLQIEIDLLQTSSYQPRNTSKSHLLTFYSTFENIKHLKYDGMIITGAPVELMEFEDVDYWNELCSILDWSRTNVYSTFHICWGAQAALYHHYGIKKHLKDEKVFGVFDHEIIVPTSPLLRGFDQNFKAPHSRHTEVLISDIVSNHELELLSTSQEAGLYIAASKDGRQIYVTGHAEYDLSTLANEYFRDLDKGLEIQVPKNYFMDNDPNSSPLLTWRAHGHLLYSNWLNYFVYQATPYDLNYL